MSALSNIRRSEKGFTLVELLIVVIILGILAAVVIPQFNSAASESKEAALASNLATVRQAIEMYKVQHDDAFPGATIVAQLTAGTDKAGAAGTAYGPYLRNGMPKNPFYSLSTGSADSVSVVTTTPAAADDSTGWLYNSVDGTIKANSTADGASGVETYSL